MDLIGAHPGEKIVARIERPDVFKAHPAIFGWPISIRRGALSRRRTEFARLLAAWLLASTSRSFHAAVEASGWTIFGVRTRQGFQAPQKAAYIGGMTASATTPLAAEITARLTQALAPSHLEVINDSHRHAGHLGDNGTGESHFTVIVESRAFAGLTRVARQRLVNHALADLLAERIHALAIKAQAPGNA